MKNNGLFISGGLGLIVFAAGAGLLWPLLSGQGQSDNTLVSATLGMTPKGDDWLAMEDDRDPGGWLAARADPPGDTREYAVLLAEAARDYEESPRMIANRIAQIDAEVMDADAGQLLRDFSWDPAQTRSFGTVAQHYLVLRRQGLDHGHALDALHAAYAEAR